MLALAVAVWVIVASGVGSASSTPTPPGGVFRIDTTGSSWQTDPGLSYIVSGWQHEYATCAKLLNYPDAPAANQSRLIPEIAATMPTISSDGRTYTFEIRNDYAFSPPATGVVTAQSMKYTFERTLSHALGSPAHQFFTNIVGEIEYNSGQASEITGIVAQGNTLTIDLIEPQGDFLTFLAMPFICAVPTSLPPVEQFAPIPSAGPYYISSGLINQRLSVTRNPDYHGPRPQPFDSYEYYFNQNEAEIKQRVESGVSDFGMGGYWEDLAPMYGPDSQLAARGLQQWYLVPATCVGYIPLNTERPLFADVNMRKAVNYAIDRSALAALNAPYAASTYDQYVVPGDPSYEDIAAYPDHPNLELARQLAGWQPGDPMRPAVLYYRTNTTYNEQQGQALRTQLLEIGIDATMVGWSGGQIYTRMGIRGEPFDLGVSSGWCSDWFDPWNTIKLLDGTTIHEGGGNLNYAYFNDPVFNDRMHAAAELRGDARYDAFREIEHDLVRGPAPWAAWRTYNSSEFYSSRIGCHHRQAAYQSANLIALCVRPEINTDDATVTEPAAGTTTVPITVRLSSEMDNAVTVDYATQDGTAVAGQDYAATSGTLTFAPHERVQTVNVTVYSDFASEPAETFYLNLSNESQGTIVDAQAAATILNQPPAPPPPGIPPPPPQPGPPPPPPPPPPACVVPRVIGLTLSRARTRIRGRHCRVGRIRRARSRRALRGRVISQSPRPGARRANGARVSLVVGRR